MADELNLIKVMRKILNVFNIEANRMFPRPFQKFNLNQKQDLIGVEIGVFEGDNALSLLKKSDIKMLYLVDLYKSYEQYNQEELNKAFKKAKRRLRKYENKITWINKNSDVAIKEIPDKIDFIYIDGSHLFKDVKKDIELYYPKIKEDGVIGGHDFPHVDNNDKMDSDVYKAVMEFIKGKKLDLFTARDDWWVIKIKNGR